VLAQQVTSLQAGWAQSCQARFLVAALAEVGVPVAPEVPKAPLVAAGWAAALAPAPAPAAAVLPGSLARGVVGAVPAAAVEVELAEPGHTAGAAAGQAAVAELGTGDFALPAGSAAELQVQTALWAGWTLASRAAAPSETAAGRAAVSAAVAFVVTSAAVEATAEDSAADWFALAAAVATTVAAEAAVTAAATAVAAVVAVAGFALASSQWVVLPAEVVALLATAAAAVVAAAAADVVVVEAAAAAAESCEATAAAGVAAEQPPTRAVPGVVPAAAAAAASAGLGSYAEKSMQLRQQVAEEEQEHQRPPVHLVVALLVVQVPSADLSRHFATVGLAAVQLVRPASVQLTAFAAGLAAVVGFGSAAEQVVVAAGSAADELANYFQWAEQQRCKDPQSFG